MDQAPAPSSETTALTFTATRGEFAKLLLVNALLTIVTLGIYRFWAKTKVRRYLWSNIRFLDDPFEYTGTPGELFIGFLIVIAILFPIGFAYGIIQSLVPPEQGWLHIALEVAYYTVLFALLQIAFYRAWRYRMSRTRWRGIRLGLDGSSWTYLRLAFGWTALTVLTLGLAYPWMQVELWRYQISHTRVGNHTFQFDGVAKILMRSWIVTAGPTYIALGVIFSTFVYFGDRIESVDQLPLHFSSDDPVVAVLFLVAVALYILSSILFFWYGIKVDRFKISNLHIGQCRFHSNLPFGRLFGFAALALGIAAIPVVILLALLIMSDGTASSSLIGFTIAIFLMAALFVPLIWAVVYSFEYLRCLIQTTKASDPDALEKITQGAADDMKSGEGLADALDVGGL